MKLSIQVFILLGFAFLARASQPDSKRDKLDNEESELNPIENNDQDLSEKDHSKRTFGSTTYDIYGLAKHIKYKGAQKLVLGYTPVDLKYVPVIRPWKNGWRFKPKPVMRTRPVLHLPTRPKPDTNGWKPILHVPPPQQNHGWTKPGVTVLKPLRPSAPDVHVQQDDHHVHNYHHDEHLHGHVHHDVVPVVPTVPPEVIPVSIPLPTVPIPTVPSVPLVPPHVHQNLHGHFDFHHQPHPEVVYYNPLTHVTQPVFVTKPDLPVLPLGASFNVPVGSVSSIGTKAPVAPVTDYYHPHFHFIPSPTVPAIPTVNALDVVHEIPAPHFHPTVTLASPTVPGYYDYHDHHVHEHVPQVYEHQPEVSQHHHIPAVTPTVPITPVNHHHHVVPVSTPIATHSYGPQIVEYHGHVAHLINTPHAHIQNVPTVHNVQNAHQYIPENYNPNILPGSTGTLSPGFLNPGYTDLQIPEYLPDHPTYHNNAQAGVAPTEETYYHAHVGLLPEGIVKPQIELEPPINK